ncbi:MAG: cytochrome c biogenesis protein CcsA [Burkholderiaceae bacterium]|jgi:ABC-type uncharacterized transport system permease subunit|nr:cytochrome c biogenesis protein CcsA [Burkholderiaceae bacterium]
MSILVSASAGAPVFMPGLVLGVLAAVAYAAPALGGRRLGVVSARRLLIAAWVLHALLIGWMLLARQPLRFGFAPALSVTVWLMLTVYVIESRCYPQMRAQRANPPMRWMMAAVGVAVVALALVFPGEHLPATASPLLPLHGALGIAAYGLFAAAVVHALILARAEVRMRHAALLSEGPESGLPLLTQERLMFGFVWAGFALLTLTLVVGALFGEQLYGAAHLGWMWDHKRVFTALSWLIFAALLLGRWKFGWRGRRALRALYAGAACLLLGYAGSRFVLEVLLHRAV